MSIDVNIQYLILKIMLEELKSTGKLSIYPIFDKIEVIIKRKLTFSEREELFKIYYDVSQMTECDLTSFIIDSFPDKKEEIRNLFNLANSDVNIHKQTESTSRQSEYVITYRLPNNSNMTQELTINKKRIMAIPIVDVKPSTTESSSNKVISCIMTKPQIKKLIKENPNIEVLFMGKF